MKNLNLILSFSFCSLTLNVACGFQLIVMFRQKIKWESCSSGQSSQRKGGMQAGMAAQDLHAIFKGSFLVTITTGNHGRT